MCLPSAMQGEGEDSETPVIPHAFGPLALEHHCEAQSSRSDAIEDPGRNRLRTVLGELLDRMEGADEVASGIAQKYPEYGAISEAVHTVTEMVAMPCELEAHGEREGEG